MEHPQPYLHAVTNEDGAVILDVAHGSISTLNPTGAYIWQSLHRGDSLATIISDLVRETGEEHILVERDVHEFAEELRKNQLLPSANEDEL
jgi:hypothetical protein